MYMVACKHLVHVQSYYETATWPGVKLSTTMLPSHKIRIKQKIKPRIKVGSKLEMY